MRHRMDADQTPRSPLGSSPAARLARARDILSEARSAPPGPLDVAAPAGAPVADPAAPSADLTATTREQAEPSPDTEPAAPPHAARSTQLALAILSGAVRPFATSDRVEPSTLTRLRTRLFPAPTAGEPSRLELTALGAALVGAAFIGSTIPGAQPVQAQGPVPLAAAPVAAAAAPAAAAASNDDAADTPAAATGDTTTPTADTTAAAAAPVSTAPAVPADTPAGDDTSGDAGDGTDPLAGGGGTTLGRVALIVAHGDAPVRWTSAADGTPAKARAAKGTVFTGLAVLPASPLASGLGFVAGQPSNPATRSGCTTPSPVTPGTTDAAGITTGTGCDYPAETPSLAGAIARDGRKWRAYVPASSAAEAAAKLCRPTDPASTEAQRAFAQRSPLGHLGDLTASGACEAAATPLSKLSEDLASDDPPAWVYVEVGECGNDGCDDAESRQRDTDLDAALASLAGAEAPNDAGAATLVVGDGDTPGLEPAPAGSFTPNAADPSAPAAVIAGAYLVGPDVTPGGTDPLALDPLAIARTQASWLGLTAPGQAAADGITALALPGS